MFSLFPGLIIRRYFVGTPISFDNRVLRRFFIFRGTLFILNPNRLIRALIWHVKYVLFFVVFHCVQYKIIVCQLPRNYHECVLNVLA